MNILMTQKRFTLTIGIHRGTLMSRDKEAPKEFDTLEECRAEVAQAEKAYHQFGCLIWFATARDHQNDDLRISLHPGNDYSS